MPLYGELRTELYRILQRARGRPMSKRELLLLLLGTDDRAAQLRLGSAIARGRHLGDIRTVYLGKYVWSGKESA